VLQARLDNLPAAEKSILQKAAVVGRIFWRGILETLEDDGTAVEATLQGLTGRELI
jgi:predicted ATPase